MTDDATVDPNQQPTSDADEDAGTTADQEPPVIDLNYVVAEAVDKLAEAILQLVDATEQLAKNMPIKPDEGNEIEGEQPKPKRKHKTVAKKRKPARQW